MIEVLVSVAILGLVVTASLKLAALSERGLSMVREREVLIDETNKMQIALLLDPLNTFGTSGDIEWKVEDREQSLWFEELAQMRGLNLGNGVSLDAGMFKGKEQKWREMEITKNGKSLTIFLPYSEEAASAKSADGVLSLDVR
jgi:hypothetical protein